MNVEFKKGPFKKDGKIEARVLNDNEVSELGKTGYLDFDIFENYLIISSRKGYFAILINDEIQKLINLQLRHQYPVLCAENNEEQAKIIKKWNFWGFKIYNERGVYLVKGKHEHGSLRHMLPKFGFKFNAERNGWILEKIDPDDTTIYEI